MPSQRENRKSSSTFSEETLAIKVGFIRGNSPVRCLPRLAILPDEDRLATEWLNARGIGEGEAILSFGGSKRPNQGINDLQPRRKDTAGQRRFQ
jgi:hypothetical protein